MHMCSVYFEKRQDSVMHDWIISLEIVKIAKKRFVYGI